MDIKFSACMAERDKLHVRRAWSDWDVVLKVTSKDASIPKSDRDGEHIARSMSVVRVPLGVLCVAVLGSLRMVSVSSYEAT